jgi:TolB-like protein/DNA-binding winged helix-turn-helix (wHTH) protein
MSSPLSVIYEFDRFRLDRRNQRLTRDGILVSMPGRTFSLLVELIEKRQDPISTEKLVNKFFPKSLSAEEDLAGEILHLKRLLHDTSTEDPILRFTPGKGYQFAAELTEYLGEATREHAFGSGGGSSHGERAEASSSTAKTKPSKKSAGKAVGIAAAVVLVAALGFAIWRFLPARSTGAGDDGSPQVAVMPFQSLTGAAGDNSFNRSLTEAIINTLGKQSQVQVVPEASLQKYLDSGAADPVTAGRELGAQMIVRGMAQRLAGRILVKVQLISTQDGSQIWSNSFEGDSKNLAGLSAQISEKIANGMPGRKSGEQP